MYRPKLSIRAMLAIVALIALACVSLVRANAVWASLMFTAALAVISFAVLAAIFRRGRKQAFWIGFALFGWLYLWMAHWPSEFEQGLFSWKLQNSNNGTLVTTQLLSWTYMEALPVVRKPPTSTAPPPQTMPGVFGGGNPNAGGFGSITPATAIPDYPALHEFMRVGHSLFTMLIAFFAGVAATYLYASSNPFPRPDEKMPS